MQLSTNLPCGPITVREYSEAREAGVLAMQPNISLEADEAFQAELSKTDPQRFTRLEAAQGRKPSTGPRWQVGICERCAKPILDAPFIFGSAASLGTSLREDGPRKFRLAAFQ